VIELDGSEKNREMLNGVFFDVSISQSSYICLHYIKLEPPLLNGRKT